MTLKALKAAIVSRLLIVILIIMVAAVFAVLLSQKPERVEDNGRLERSIGGG